MIGPTGVGKTEIARRLAKLIKAPFLKVEATKFTEVGYVGRDVESMIRDLVEVAVNIVKEEKMAFFNKKAEELAEERLLEIIVPASKKEPIPITPLKLFFRQNQVEHNNYSEIDQARKSL